MQESSVLILERFDEIRSFSVQIPICQYCSHRDYASKIGFLKYIYYTIRVQLTILRGINGKFDSLCNFDLFHCLVHWITHIFL